MQTDTMTPPPILNEASVPIRALVLERTMIATDIAQFTLAPTDGQAFPAWEPGAHIEVVVQTTEGDVFRHYSLMGDPADSHVWTIGVLKDPNSRGGSAAIHENLRAGDILEIRKEANHFPLVDAPSYVFIAGGIGITPIVPLAAAAVASGSSVRVVQLARSHDRLVDITNVSALAGAELRAIVSDTRTPLPEILGDLPPGTAVYACGPSGLLDALTDMSLTEDWSFHCERFVSPDTVDTGENRAFTIELAHSGKTLEVDSDSSVLDVLLQNGIPVDYSCKEGICSTCETGVLEGEVDHRDHVLDETERAENSCMMVCVSRACSQRLILDL